LRGAKPPLLSALPLKEGKGESKRGEASLIKFLPLPLGKGKGIKGIGFKNFMEDIPKETKQERRERKLKKKRERIPQHGKNLAKVYMDAIMKRLRGK
jgi:hypothetical protein